MKHLIISGDQATGKTLLGNWLRFAQDIHIYDDCNLEIILKHAYASNITRPNIYITNDLITYEQVSAEDFLIIKLCKLNS